MPAVTNGMHDNRANVDTIANSTQTPTFDNTIVAMERVGALLGHVSTAIFSLAEAKTHEEMQKIQAEMAPKRAAHIDQTMLKRKLFGRVRSVYEQREPLGLDAESRRQRRCIGAVSRFHWWRTG